MDVCTLAHTHKHIKCPTDEGAIFSLGLNGTTCWCWVEADSLKHSDFFYPAAVGSRRLFSTRRPFECCLKPGAVSNSNKQQRRILSRCRTRWPKETEWGWSSSQSKVPLNGGESFAQSQSLWQRKKKRKKNSVVPNRQYHQHIRLMFLLWPIFWQKNVFGEKLQHQLAIKVHTYHIRKATLPLTDNKQHRSGFPNS